MSILTLSCAARRKVGVLVAALALAGLTSCERSAPLEPGRVRSVALIPEASTLRPGRRMTVLAVPLDIQGNILDVPVTWQSLTPALLAVDARGEVTALAPGTGTLRATAAGVSGTLELALVNPPASRLLLSPDTLSLFLPGPSTRVQALALDSADQELVGARIHYRSDAARIAAVDDSGRVTPQAVGRSAVIAEFDGLRAERPLRVTPLPTATAPVVTAVSAAVIRPGVAFTIQGTRFGATAGANSVQVDGIAAAVTAASESEITAVLPPGSFPCTPTTTVAVQVTTAGGVGAGESLLEVAPQRSLAVGDALILGSAAASACNELREGEGRYLIALQHAGRALGAGGIAVSVEGRSGVNAPVMALTLPALPLREARADAHHALQQRNRAAAAIGRPAPPQAEAALQVPPVNGIVPVRIPNLDAPNFCSSFTPIGARTVYDGPRIAILEDTLSLRGGTPTLAGVMDATLRELGQEVESVMLPLAEGFGNPLAMDSRLDANGKIVLVVTPRMNDMLDGALLGAVVTCDFFPRAQFASSNFGEMLYLQAPTSADAGFGLGSVERWRWEIRGTIAHELKHVASFAERIVRGQPLEESWLEEATARHAEERYARARLGFGPRDDVGFSALQCEVSALAGAPGCIDAPRVLLPHFEALWDFLDTPGARSPLGPTVAGDFSFYGSAWSLLRWAMDHATLDEAAFIAQLTSSGQSGIQNLEGRSGRPWEDILAQWTLALLAETAGLSPTAPTLRFPSWDFADAFAGLCAALTPCTGGGSSRFRRARPLQPLPAAAPAWALTLRDLQPAGFVAVDVAPGALGSRRLIRVHGERGGPIPSPARLVILRVE